MSISTTTQTLHEGVKNLIVQWTGVSDGSGSETKVKKVDVSTLTPACNAVRVDKISGNVEFGIVELWWDALVPVKFAELSGDINLDYSKTGGLNNNAGGGKTGDLLLSTVAFELNSTYNLHLEMVKK